MFSTTKLINHAAPFVRACSLILVIETWYHLFEKYVYRLK